ncbi:DUF2892 domain-containing protein [Shinella daejeonensis]|nr:DUF2892 domain-containing protein [Shinella daejeonensis]MCP8894706.1 DUF2892 domain-containing protein [Shinella daejeonensis]
MKINVGTPDHVARLVIVGLVLAVTGVVRFCPAYRIFNLSTSRTTDK